MTLRILPAEAIKDNQLTWRDVFARRPRGGQNAAKREAINRMLKAHPDWSSRRIADGIHILIITDLDFDEKVTPETLTTELVEPWYDAAF